MFLSLLDDNTRVALARLKELRVAARALRIQLEFLHHVRLNGCRKHHCHVVTVVMMVVVMITCAVAWILGWFL